MLDALSITEADAAGLSELAALDLAMARDFAARAQAAEDPETANDLARSYQRVARSYRQTLALKVRLQREMAQAQRDAPPPPPPPRDEARIAARAEVVRRAVGRVIFAEREAADACEAEDDDGHYDYLLDLLDDRLAHLARADGFGLDPLDAQVRAVASGLGLDPALAARWRDLPDPDDPPDDDVFLKAEDDPDAAWRGSG